MHSTPGSAAAGGTDRSGVRLGVLRHAKSAWPDVPDLHRPLAPRGRRDAPRIGDWLRGAGFAPDLVVCSPAERTRQTWELLAPRLDGAPLAVSEPKIYAAYGTALLELVRTLPADCRTVLLIGHQPGVQELVLALTGQARGDALERLREKFPTAAVALLEAAGDWADLEPGDMVLTDFAVPRELPQAG